MQKITLCLHCPVAASVLFKYITSSYLLACYLFSSHKTRAQNEFSLEKIKLKIWIHVICLVVKINKQKFIIFCKSMALSFSMA